MDRDDILRRMLVSRALKNAESESATVRAALYDAAALVLPSTEAEEAKVVAFLIREGERSQLKFQMLLKEEGQ